MTDGQDREEDGTDPGYVSDVAEGGAAKLLEAGAIPFQKPGRHRRGALSDLVADQEHEQDERRSALRELAALTQGVGTEPGPVSPLRRHSEFEDDA
ncbi:MULTISPECIES: hypothetical protein [unclassified Curtobacterium]|uniref:hypothetical protein n=1 Tax=unclassified Curtobacterium TaxID=257496 RepID=UPI0011B7529A|nr:MULTISPECIES: hypothetical protein [unclassified Curtobacterium]WIE54423.1 hypothetical protein DEI88_015095 [Curtobacterium sp. MCBD17_003]